MIKDEELTQKSAMRNLLDFSGKVALVTGAAAGKVYKSEIENNLDKVYKKPGYDEKDL